MRKWIAALIATTTLSGGTLYGADQRANPYEDKETHYELAIKSDIPQGERVEIHKDKAQMDLIGWNDEYKISIIPQIPTSLLGAGEKEFTVPADRPLLSKKMEFREGDVTAFIEPKSENEFDIDFTLHAKPDTNVFEYKIEGAEDFDFFYQPELTPEEIAEGAERPENVIGSYAVYHKTKAHHREAATNYATGKVMHILAPYAIDANGNEIKCALLYFAPTLSVTCPQEFLDEAVYPVVVDPTFGNTNIGASEQTGARDREDASMFSLTEDGTVTKITVYFARSAAIGTIPFDVAIRDSAASAALIAQSDTGTLTTVSTTYAWFDFDFNDALTASNYFLSVWYGLSTTETSKYKYDTSGDTTRGRFNFWNNDPVSQSGVWNDPLVGSAQDRLLSMYATYTASCDPETETCTSFFGTAGYHTWTVPTGVTSADIACWGGGGGGGDGTNAGGGGGGGGAFASTTQAVTASDVIRLFIGSGGGVNSNANGSGGATTTASTTAPSLIVSASPGGGGRAGVNADATGGTGGQTALSTGTTLFAGGDGGGSLNTGDVGGGGGGSAGPHGAGAAGATAAAGLGGVGGKGDNNNGGNGGLAPSGAVGMVASSSPLGGGGGGGGDDTFGGGAGGTVGGGGGGSEGTAGIGQAGQCTITYTVAAAGGDAAPGADTGILWFD